MNLQHLKIGYWPYHTSLSSPGDRRRFIFYANERKIIFELIDSYLLEDINLFVLLRGPARFLGKKESGLYFNYRQAILLMVQKADAVVCSTALQRDFMLHWNNNI